MYGQRKTFNWYSSLRDLVTADPSKPIGDVMTRDVVNISTNTNQEEVAELYKDMIF